MNSPVRTVHGAPRNSFLEVVHRMAGEIEELSEKIAEMRKEIIFKERDILQLTDVTETKRKERESAVVTLEAKKARTSVLEKERAKTARKKQVATEMLEKLEKSYEEGQAMQKNRCREGIKELIRLTAVAQDISRHYVQELDVQFERMKMENEQLSAPHAPQDAE